MMPLGRYRNVFPNQAKLSGTQVYKWPLTSATWKPVTLCRSTARVRSHPSLPFSCPAALHLANGQQWCSTEAEARQREASMFLLLRSLWHLCQWEGAPLCGFSSPFSPGSQLLPGRLLHGSISCQAGPAPGYHWILSASLCPIGMTVASRWANQCFASLSPFPLPTAPSPE